MAQLDQNPLVVVARYLVIHMVDPLGNRIVFRLTTTIHFLLERCLTLSSETTNPVSRDPWATIRQRINTVFGEDLIDWSEAAKAPKTSSRSGH